MISYKGKNKKAVNYLKTTYFDHPEWVECDISIMTATWIKYRDEVEDIVLAHPRIFPTFKKGQYDFDFPTLPPLYELGDHRDAWGTLWRNIERGMDSIPIECPLEDWDAFDTWTPPEPLTQSDWGPQPNWDDVRKSLDVNRAAGELATGGGLPHGHFFMRLYYVRGFDNLMIDMATDDPRLQKLITVVTDYNVAVVQKYVELGADHVVFGEDLGMQNALPISPEMWRKYVKPSYEATVGPCRDLGLPVYMHSDGHILEIIPDLKDVGVTMINPQIRANGIDGIRDVIKGNLAMNLDLDRQLFPFASKQEIVDHVHEAYDKLYMPEGGLSFTAECEPDVPLENIETICAALEEVCDPPEPEYRKQIED
jgi:hypothetical protein